MLAHSYLAEGKGVVPMLFHSGLLIDAQAPRTAFAVCCSLPMYPGYACPPRLNNASATQSSTLKDAFQEAADRWIRPACGKYHLS